MPRKIKSGLIQMSLPIKSNLFIIKTFFQQLKPPYHAEKS